MRSRATSGGLAACLLLTLTSACAAPLATQTPTGASRSSAIRLTEPPPIPPPSASPGETAVCSSAGRVETGAYPGAVLEEEIPFRVYLPPCYELGDATYPTLYALHGKPFDESHWDDLGLDEVADAGIAAGDWPPFLIVMPYLPEPLYSSTDGGPGSYEQELLEGLIPFIEGSYASEPSAASRWLAGISRGGVWALEVGLSHPEVFGGVAALSPALAVNNSRPQYDPLVIASGAGPFPPRLFLSAGETDWARAATERLSGILEEAGADVALRITPGGHELRAWEEALRPMLEALAAGAAAEP